ncbi:MAG TPA: PAS domain S-box protein, partial [Polyangiaceae bacterium]
MKHAVDQLSEREGRWLMTSPKLNVVQSPSVPALSWDDCRLLVESVVDYAIFMLDVNGCVATWSAGAEKIKGYKANEIIGQHCSAFYTPEDLARGAPEQELERASRLGRVEEEGWRLRKDGSRFWAHLVITALRDDSGTLRGYGKVTRDLTTRRVASEQLQSAEQRFHHLVDAVIDYAIFLLDPTGHVSTWNSGAKRVKGYTAEEIIGNHFSIFYTPEDRVAGKPEAILEAVRQRGRFEDESWRVRKDGTRFWANVIITALRDEQGTLVGFAKVTRDLTDRRRAEEALRRSEERFRLLIENVGDYAIYMLDDEGKVTSWNVGAERMKGYTAEEIIGQNFEIFFPDEDRAAGKPASEVERARIHGRCEDEGWRIRKDGTRFWANAILTALRDSQGSLVGFAKITRDLTLRREAEEQERRLLKEQTARQVAESAELLLREGEERYRSLSRRLEVVFESVVDAILVQDATGRVVFANSAAARAWGVESREGLLERNAADIYERLEFFDADGRAVSYADLPSQRVLAGVPTSSVVLQVRD